ncbi:hypothetical protein [Azospirillum picis]|uniref:Uncharacterized protein n=1 Tax=Azospirillum picis TaxID=488438 RepID=A0ABU0MQA7_9PROT|nr:hypothetical protein [Azospirillum picis]MBP2301577.1 hypothetical protein [Azospirillum picis]MDQ0535409.1 hypothetical protein [Azospirillum picis]
MSPFDEQWARCEPWLAAALEHAHGTHLIEDIREGCLAGNLQFWPGKSAAIVTEICTYPRLKAVNFFLVGGDLEELLAMKPVIEAWAKRLGCTRAQCGGRFGWERVLKDYRRACVVLEKEI